MSGRFAANAVDTLRVESGCANTLDKLTSAFKAETEKACAGRREHRHIPPVLQALLPVPLWQAATIEKQRGPLAVCVLVLTDMTLNWRVKTS